MSEQFNPLLRHASAAQQIVLKLFALVSYTKKYNFLNFLHTCLTITVLKRNVWSGKIKLHKNCFDALSQCYCVGSRYTNF